MTKAIDELKKEEQAELEKLSQVYEQGQGKAAKKQEKVEVEERKLDRVALQLRQLTQKRKLYNAWANWMK